jgi:hypothetical protein
VHCTKLTCMLSALGFDGLINIFSSGIKYLTSLKIE